MKKILFISLISLFILSTSYCQSFQKGQTIIGPTIGYGLGFGFGASLEYGFSDNLGIGGDLAIQNFSEDFKVNTYSGKWDYNLLGILASVTYHFQPNKSFDPFIRLGVGYFNYDAKYSDNRGSSIELNSASYTSGLGYSGQIGFRYYFSTSTALRLAAGYPFYVSGGVDFSL